MRVSVSLSDRDRHDWRDQAACKAMDPRDFDDKGTPNAWIACRRECSVRAECRSAARLEQPHGVYRAGRYWPEKTETESDPAQSDSEVAGEVAHIISGKTAGRSSAGRYARFRSAQITAMGKPDGCPECVLNVESPRSVSPTADGFRATYICSDCGHTWTTSWRDD